MEEMGGNLKLSSSLRQKGVIEIITMIKYRFEKKSFQLNKNPFLLPTQKRNYIHRLDKEPFPLGR